MMRFFSFLVLGVVLTASVGCGSNEPFDYTKVSGSVMYDDETLIDAPAIEVTFYPQAEPKDEKTHPRPGVAVVDPATGKFTSVTSHKPNDGVVPGLQKVTVQTFDESHTPTDVLPKEYTDVLTTPLTFDTTKGEPANFKIPKKK